VSKKGKHHRSTGHIRRELYFQIRSWNNPQSNKSVKKSQTHVNQTTTALVAVLAQTHVHQTTTALVEAVLAQTHVHQTTTALVEAVLANYM
jgi:hypothetical protein